MTKTQIIEEAGVCVVRPSGRLDGSMKEQFSQDVIARIHEGVSHMVLDLSNVPFVSSAGLGILIDLTKRLQGKISVCCLSEEIRSILRITRLDQLLHLFDEYEMAMQFASR